MQTGISPLSVTASLKSAGGMLQEIAAKRAVFDRERQLCAAAPLELAFFGGTFTALPENDFEACLAFAAYWQKRGLVGKLRCSTRPDAISPDIVERLGEAGFACVELGIQSFSDKALLMSQRGYDGETARRACAMLAGMQARTGVSLGIQLLPGMPGLEPGEALADIKQRIVFRPSCVRL